MATHTAGPWHAEPTRSIQNGALIPEIGAILDLDCRVPGLSMANATLAASAPDMLTALRGVHAMLSQPVFMRDHGAGPSYIMSGDAATARKWIEDVIAKAEAQP